MLAPVTNLISFTGLTDIHAFVPGYFGAEFWDDPELYLARSPIFNVKEVKTPTLILHGEGDTRVPISQSFEFYDALKHRGREVKMVAYPRMPHGPTEPRHHLDIMERTLAWFDRFLG